MAIKQWLTGVGDWNNASLWSGGVPASGDIAIIPGGSSSIIRGQSLDGISVLLTRDGTQTTDLTLQNSVLGSTSSIVGYEKGGPVSVTLANSVVDGIIGSALGQTNINVSPNGYGVNMGAVSVGDDVGTSSVFINANYGQFYNFGTMYAENHAAIVVSFGQAQLIPGFPQNAFNGPQQVFTNAGMIEAAPNSGEIYFQGNYGGAPPGTVNTGIIANTGTIEANGGIVTVAADLTQAGNGIVKVENGGTLNMLGQSDGGTIEITSGSLNFGVFSRYHNGAVAAREFHSTLVLDGETATLGFGARDMQIAFDEARQELIVQAPQVGGNPPGVADIHVAGVQGGLHASDFTISGSNVLFAHHSA